MTVNNLDFLPFARQRYVALKLPFSVADRSTKQTE